MPEKKSLSIYLVGTDEQINKFVPFLEFSNYFMKLKYKNKNHSNNIDSYRKKNIDFLFLWYKKGIEKRFDWYIYSCLHANNRKFKLIWILAEDNPNLVIKLLKNGADDYIVYNNQRDELKWKVFSLIRRRWDGFHKNSQIIYKYFILDRTTKTVCFSNKNKIVKLSKKEFEFLWILCRDSKDGKEFVSKKEIYKFVWGYNDNDTTRVLDQIYNRLKNKLGSSFFISNRQKGIKIK